jgi:hypothetical protein
MRRIALVILALVASLVAPLGSSPAASAAPVAAVPMFGSVTTAFTTNRDPLASQRFKIVGQVFLVLGDSPVPLPNAAVTVQRRDTPTGPWVPVASATTAEATLPNGEKHIMYSVVLTARRTAWYRAVYAGSPDSEAIGPSASDDGAAVPVLVRVHRNMPIRLQQPRPGRIFLAGVVRPEYARQRVVVLRKACGTCAWRTFARPLTDGSGRYRTQLSIPRRRSHFFIVRARASRGFALSYSQRVRIRAG